MELIYELGRVTTPQMIGSAHWGAYLCWGGPFLFSKKHSAPSIRTPLWHQDQAGETGLIPDADEWHHDGFVGAPPRWMLVWTNVIPTHVRLPDGTETRARPFQMTLINNHECQHKAPRLSDWALARRYFYRQHIDEPLTPRDIAAAQRKLAKWVDKRPSVG